MKCKIVIISFLGLLVSCSNAEHNKSRNDTITVTEHSDVEYSTDQRLIIIQELEKLRNLLLSGDKQKIATIFQFPLADTTVGIYLEDSAYNSEFTANGNMTTESMFLRFFPQISASLQLQELNELFRVFRLEDLQQKDTLRRDVKVKAEPCFKFYGIEIQGNQVTLTTGQGVNDTFKSQKSMDDDIPENSSEFCESVTWWIFQFNGRELRFVKQTGAG
jgi:hypothetical protein